ncbi:MAG: choice-of-anchor L domain-containing protein [Bacteroidota bacterium]
MLIWTRLSLSFFAFFLTLGQIFAQAPANDDCSGLINLGEAPYCPDVSLPGGETDIYTNTEATASDIGSGNIPSCFANGATDRDVWFSFVASDTILDYTITVMGIEGPAGESAMTNPQVAIYRGGCATNGLAEIDCASAEAGENTVDLNVDGLTPGITYFLRINDYPTAGTPNDGSFKLCIIKKDPINLITDGGSTDCTGVLFDSGGPEDDYGNNENNAFTICPTQPNQCIVFTLDYYNIEYIEQDNDPGEMPQISDLLLFYDGPSVNPATLISTLGGISPQDPTVVSANSGVCYEVTANSGCLTVQFVSDGTTTYQGFSGAWECSTTACESAPVLSVDENVTNPQIESILSSVQTQITVVDINCEQAAYGTFLAGDNSDLGLEQGLILATGEITNAIGPNDMQGDPFIGDFFRDGDPDLDSLSVLTGNDFPSRDACVIELEVFANTNELSFEYVFGSEEYPEYINQEFNDIFAFLISGPGITGLPQLDGQENIAVIPNTNTFVEINSINHLTNWEYYRNNESSLSLQYDGLTSDFQGLKKSLTARRAVEPCNTYRLKLAIADRFDWVWDSGVFISEIGGSNGNIDIIFNSGVDYLIEDCSDTPDEIVISLDNTSDSDITYSVQLSGTAQEGQDYLLDVPSTLTFPPGENEFSFPITTLSDLDDGEGTETVIITLNGDFGCGLIEIATLEVELRDQFLVEIDLGDETPEICAGSSLALSASEADSYFWTPSGLFDDPTSASPVVMPIESGWFFVEGRIGQQCVATDSIFIEVITPSISIEADQVGICLGQTVELSATHNGLDEQVTWSPATELSTTIGPNTEATPEFSTVYFATLELFEGCSATDNILVSVDFLNVPELNPDITVCQGTPVVLAELADPDTTSTVYSWSPATGLDTPNSPTPQATPDQTTTYQLISTGISGACADTATVTIMVIPAAVEILGLDTLSVCLGSELELEAVTSTGFPLGLFWTSSDNSLNASDVGTVAVTPENETTYIATFTVAECVVRDSVFIQVDEIMEVDLIDDQIVCNNETPTFILNNTSGQAGVVYNWTSTNEDFTSVEPDPEVSPTSTTSYFFSAELGDCMIFDTVTITFIPPATITAGPAQITEEDGNGNLLSVNLTATVTPTQDPDSLIWTFLGPDGPQIGTGPSVEWVPDPVDSLPDFAYISVNTGCELLIDSILIQRLDYRVPDIFSPNNDGVNDVFRPFFLGEMDVVEVRVYNRWGQLVFESNDPSNPGWDGTYNGKAAPSDAYLWEISVGLSGDIKHETGHVTLVR